MPGALSAASDAPQNLTHLPEAAVMEYFEEAGIDVENPDQVLDEAEVFDVGDGRYLIVEG